MSTKFLLYILGTLLLVQCALANVIEKKSVPEEADSPNVAALDFFANSLFRTFSLIDKTYEFSQSILEPAFADVTVTKDVTKTTLQTKFEELKEYLHKSHNLVADDERKNKAAFLEGLDKMIGDIHETETKSEDLSTFEKSALKAIENFKTETYKNLDTVVTHIVADAEDYWEEMGSAKQQEKQKFYDTILLLKNETDPEKKSDLITVLLESGSIE